MITFTKWKLTRQLKHLPPVTCTNMAGILTEPINFNELPPCRLKTHLKWRNAFFKIIVHIQDEFSLIKAIDQLKALDHQQWCETKNNWAMIQIAQQIQKFVNVGLTKSNWQRRFAHAPKNSMIPYGLIDQSMQSQITGEFKNVWAVNLAKYQQLDQPLPTSHVLQRDCLDQLFDPLMHAFYREYAIEKTIENTQQMTELIDLVTGLEILWANIWNAKQTPFTYWVKTYLVQASSHTLNPFANQNIANQGLIQFQNVTAMIQTSDLHTWRGPQLWQWGYQQAEHLKKNQETPNPFLDWPRFVSGTQILTALKNQDNQPLQFDVQTVNQHRPLKRRLIKQLKIVHKTPHDLKLVCADQVITKPQLLAKTSPQFWLATALNMSNCYYDQNLKKAVESDA